MSSLRDVEIIGMSGPEVQMPSHFQNVLGLRQKVAEYPQKGLAFSGTHKCHRQLRSWAHEGLGGWGLAKAFLGISDPLRETAMLVLRRFFGYMFLGGVLRGTQAFEGQSLSWGHKPMEEMVNFMMGSVDPFWA